MRYLQCNESDLKLSETHDHIKYEIHPKVEYKDKVCVKPWGHEFLISQNKSIGIWFLRITGGHRTSVHCHYNKDTTMVVLRGSMRLELVDGEIMTVNEMESVYVPHYKFHSIGSFSPETYLIEIETYNDSIDFSDKNDLLRITDIYKRRDNKYESSIDLSDELDKYGYFYLDPNFRFIFKDIELNVGYTIDKKADYNLLLNGKININGNVVSPGSFIRDETNITHLEDKSLFLTIKNVGSKENHKILHDDEQLKTTVKHLKMENKKIVLTSGCFDIVHVGHIQHLIHAKNDGDILMVCLSSDEQIRHLKGDTRPINSYWDRIDLFKMIECVDYIILYNEVNSETEETLGNIMQIVDPSLWVKGSDYNIETIRQKHPYLKAVKIYNNVPNFSTTNIIKKILKNN